MVSADFTVNGESNPAAHEVAYGAVATFALLSTSGADSIECEIVSSSKSGEDLPTVTLGGSPLGATATCTMPADPADGLGRSFRVKYAVSTRQVGADGKIVQDVRYAVFGALNDAGLLPICVGEELDRNGTHGVTETVNEALRGVGQGGISGALQYHDTSLSPVGLWQLNKSLIEVVSGLSLTLDGGTIQYAQIRPSAWGFAFNGNTQLQRSTRDAALARTGALSCSMLLHIPDYPSALFTLLSMGSSDFNAPATNCLYRLSVDTNLNLVYQSDSGSGPTTYTGTFSSSDATLPLGVLFHLGFTRSADNAGTQTIKMYLQGTQVGSSITNATTPTGGTQTTGDPVRFGISGKLANNSSDRIPKGVIMLSPKIYPAELSAADMKAEYNRCLENVYGHLA